MRLFLSTALLFFGLGLAGCANQSGPVGVDIDLAGERTVYVNKHVELGPLQVYVHPDGEPPVPPRALFVPLRMTQRMEYAQQTGHNISRLIWQTWLQEQVFPTLEFAAMSTPYRPDLALSLAARKGADMVVGGYITHFLDGGTMGDTNVSITVEAYDVKTGNLMWSMAQGGRMQRDHVADYLLFAVKTRLPSDPAAAVTTALAADMAVAVRNWVNGEGEGPEKGPWYNPDPGAFR